MRTLFLALLLTTSSAMGQVSGAGQLGCQTTPATGTGWTTATSVNATQILASNCAGAQMLVTLDQGTTLTVGAIQFQGDPGDGTFINIAAWQVVDPTTPPFATISQPYTLQASTNKQFLILMAGMYRLQLKLTTAITGSATVTPYTMMAPYPFPITFQATAANLLTTAAQPTAANLNATVVGAGTAGSANANPVTVQGIASMTKLLVTPDSVALPANQSVNAAQINGVAPLMGNGTTGTGSQRVTIASDNTAFAVNAAATLNAETTKVIGTARIQGNLGAAVDAATGAAPPANAVLAGGLTSGATGGFVTALPICDSFANINISTATTTLLITGVSGRHVRICHIDMIALLADNVGIISGTGATCGTGTAAIVGTTAATGYNLAANGGISSGTGLGTVMRTVATGDSVCAITSAATQLSGVISYTIY